MNPAAPRRTEMLGPEASSSHFSAILATTTPTPHVTSPTYNNTHSTHTHTRGEGEESGHHHHRTLQSSKTARYARARWGGPCYRWTLMPEGGG
jgi:hypothetical protein